MQDCSDLLKDKSGLLSCEKRYSTVCKEEDQTIGLFFFFLTSCQDAWTKGDGASWKKWHLN